MSNKSNIFFKWMTHSRNSVHQSSDTLTFNFLILFVLFVCALLSTYSKRPEFLLLLTFPSLWRPGVRCPSCIYTINQSSFVLMRSHTIILPPLCIQPRAFSVAQNMLDLSWWEKKWGKKITWWMNELLTVFQLSSVKFNWYFCYSSKAFFSWVSLIKVDTMRCPSQCLTF